MKFIMIIILLIIFGKAINNKAINSDKKNIPSNNKINLLYRELYINCTLIDEQYKIYNLLSVYIILLIILILMLVISYYRRLFEYN